MLCRYMRRDGTMRLADFVSAILHLTMAFELFKAKDTNQDNQIKMGVNEVRRFRQKIVAQCLTELFCAAVDQISPDMLNDIKSIIDFKQKRTQLRP